MKFLIRNILMAATLYVSSTSLALGASLLITSSGGGSYTVQGENMNGVAGIDLTIGYDASSLSTPTVSWGGLVAGALSIANTNVPGNIKIAIIRTEPFSGSGPIAALSFATQSGTGGITSVSAKLIDSKGGAIPVQAAVAPGVTGSGAAGQGLITTPGVPFSQPDSSRTSSATAVTTTVPAAVTQVPSSLGSVTMPGDGQSRSEKQPVETKSARTPESQEISESVTRQMKSQVEEKGADPVEPVDTKQTQTIHGSVLERFRTHQGEKNPEILIALFTKEVSPSIRQEPAIVISDGKEVVRVTVDVSAVKGASTSFALTGAKMVSLKREDDSSVWILEALPQADALKAAVTLMNSSSIIEFPLTIVPPAGVVTSSRADFAVFLKDSGAKAPKYDLNGDGRHDYQDDYIYTAHYLIKTGTAEKNTKKP
jgi:hypothetical protein